MKKLSLFLFASLLFCFCASVNSVIAQEQFKMTITPPLVKNNMDKGEAWASYVKVTNNNQSAIRIYIQKLDFKSREDGAGPEFIKPGAEDSKYFLSQWIEIDNKPVDIQPQQSVNIPFVIKIPQDATPGGHYAAILAGTSPQAETKGTVIKTSSQLATLLLVNIKGDVKEKAEIREFSTDRSIYQSPKVNMTVKFANIGNVHLQPKGEIKITKMFGKEVDKITLNHSTSEYGNVLPESIRKWSFDWEKKDKLTNFGRYKADLVMNYGSESKETLNYTLYFWVVNFKMLGAIILVIILIILFIRWIFKRSIRKAILEANVNKIENQPVQPVEETKTTVQEVKKDKTINLRTIDKNKNEKKLN